MKKTRQKVEDLKVSQGKMPRPVTMVSKSGKRSLGEILGKKFSQYPQDNEDEYTDSLRNMNKADLQVECLRVGLNPTDSRDIMVERLLNQYRAYAAEIRTANLAPKTLNTPSAKVRKILGKGGNPLV